VKVAIYVRVSTSEQTVEISGRRSVSTATGAAGRLFASTPMKESRARSPTGPN
jgi:DNA invertase Pin-like site-specific DNA recombinase